eukprot:356889-Chlamydomonas_euryale.AAC.4
MQKRAPKQARGAPRTCMVVGLALFTWLVMFRLCSRTACGHEGRRYWQSLSTSLPMCSPTKPTESMRASPGCMTHGRVSATMQPSSMHAWVHACMPSAWSQTPSDALP